MSIINYGLINNLVRPSTGEFKSPALKAGVKSLIILSGTIFAVLSDVHDMKNNMQILKISNWMDEIFIVLGLLI